MCVIFYYLLKRGYTHRQSDCLLIDLGKEHNVNLATIKKLYLLPIIVTFCLIFNFALLTNLHHENKVLQNVILDFRHVSKDLYELHRSMLNMVNADQAFAATAEIPFLKQFILSSDEFKANIYSLKQSLVSLPLAYKVLEEVEFTFLRWLNTSYPDMKRYQGNVSQSVASELSQSLDESVRTKAIQQITGLVAQVKDMWYEHVIVVVEQANANAKSIQHKSIVITLGGIVFLAWVVRRRYIRALKAPEQDGAV